MRDEEVLGLLRDAVRAVRDAIADQHGRGLSGARPSQYHADLAADRAALDVLVGGGLRVFSEESGATGEGALTCVLDPVDGSTNFDRGIPFYACSLCVVDDAGPWCALVANLASGVAYEAVRGSGATRDGEPIRCAGTTDLSRAIVSFSGLPARHGGWAQYRALGSAALELCAVADGSLDAFAVVGTAHLSPWDYLAGHLLVTEAGGAIASLDDAPLVEVASTRRRLAAASTEALLERVVELARPRTDRS